MDCGSGIGRITKHLLLPSFKIVDMVDVTLQFIEESKNYIGAENERVGNKFVEGLQTFAPQENFYDLIWIQWVSGHLTDEDFVDFIKRCKVGFDLQEYFMFEIKFLDWNQSWRLCGSERKCCQS